MQATVTQPGLVQVGPAQVSAWEARRRQGGQVQIGSGQMLPPTGEPATRRFGLLAGRHGCTPPSFTLAGGTAVAVGYHTVYPAIRRSHPSAAPRRARAVVSTAAGPPRLSGQAVARPSEAADQRS